MKRKKQVKTVALIVAGGQGKRMGGPKQFLLIAGRPMLRWTVEAFSRSPLIDGIIIVVDEKQLKRPGRWAGKKLIQVVPGGRERQDSVRNGLAALPQGAEIVVIHDGARPAITPALIAATVQAAKNTGAAIAAIPVKDTIKKVVNGKRIALTLDRSGLWQAQTPQAFRREVIEKAYAKLKSPVTDDAAAVEKLGLPVEIVVGLSDNIKVTTPDDLNLMALILKRRLKR